MVRHTARTPIATLVLTLCALVAAALLAPSAGTANAARKPATPTKPANAPGTAGSCQVAPPPAIDTSENPAPGQPSPTPVPEPATPVGGTRMGECGLVLPPGAPPVPPNVGYESWVLQDLDSGAVLAAKDPHARERPASLIKLLLALVVSRELQPNTIITGTQDDANQQGTRVGIGPGGQYTVSQLVHALLMHSGNDVAYALAMQLGGYQVAVDKMNALARQLGALDTRAATPSGLDGPGMSTSAYDMSVIFRAALNNPMIADAVHTRQMTMPGYPAKPASFVVSNDNWLLATYPGDLGGKTGYTDDALQTYANAAGRDGHRVALIGMRGTTHLEGSHADSKALMDYGFALEGAHTPAVGQIVDSGPQQTGNQAPSGSTGAKPKPASPRQQQGGSVSSGLSPFGTVGVPLTILAAIGLVVIALMYLRRQRAKRARAERAKAAVAAKEAATKVPGTTINGTTNAAVVTDPEEKRNNGVSMTETTDVFDKLQ